MRILVTGASGFIGTNFVDSYGSRSGELINVDIKTPLRPEQKRFWTPGDIMNAAQLARIFADFEPTHVVHMAARTDCQEDTTVEQGYAVNTTGTANVLAAIKNTSSIERVVVVSTQYVAGPQRLVQGDEDYFPHTVYGQSKVITEQLVREANLNCTWTLVRPTNVWGPWHMRYRSEAWKVIRKGLYLHPGGGAVTRSYGFVGNVVWQIGQILEAPSEVVDRQVFYVGDPPADIYEWVNAFSVALRGRPARRVPRSIVSAIGRFGDLLTPRGIAFPLTSSRFKNMISDYPTPMDKTTAAFGSPPYSLEAGVRQTVEWLESVGWE